MKPTALDVLAASYDIDEPTKFYSTIAIIVVEGPDGALRDHAIKALEA